MNKNRMKYIEITAPGGPEVLQLAETDIPSPGKGQVLVKIAAAGVNRPDVFQRMGIYPPPPGAPDIPGLEIAGEIVATGTDSGELKTGDRVCALITGGGYAEYALADAVLCLPVPSGLSDIEAAAIPETYFTVWSNVFDRGQLKAEETFLVHGGSSGIGTTAIQLARAFSATVFATAGSDEKCEHCRALGASYAINYRSRDFVEECLQATGNRGIDVILDMVAGDYIGKNLRVAAEDGRVVVIATLAGQRAEVDIRPIIQKRLLLTGSRLRPRSVAFKATIAKSLLKNVWPLLESGQVKPVIYRTFPLEMAADAHRLMESSEHTGKIMLVTGETDDFFQK